MPSKKKSVAKKQTKSAFVMALDPKLTPKQVVAKGKAAGTALSQQHVRDIRWEAKRARKSKTAKVAAPKRTTNAAPRKAKAAVKQTKRQFVLAQDSKLPAARIVALARSAGFTLTPHRVHNIRWAAKHKAKARAGKSAHTRPQPKPGKLRRLGRRLALQPAPLHVSIGAKGGIGAIAGIGPLDLAYAVGRLVAQGKTTAAEVAQLAAERAARIESLQTELAALKGGIVPTDEVAVPSPGSKPRKQVVKPAARAKSAKRTKAKAVKGKVSTRRDGRSFTTTAKVIAARKWQGQYMGYLRQIPEADKPRFRALAKEKGIPAAVGELKTRLGKS